MAVIKVRVGDLKQVMKEKLNHHHVGGRLLERDANGDVTGDEMTAWLETGKGAKFVEMRRTYKSVSNLERDAKRFTTALKRDLGITSTWELSEEALNVLVAHHLLLWLLSSD